MRVTVTDNCTKIKVTFQKKRLECHKKRFRPQLIIERNRKQRQLSEIKLTITNI